MELFFFFSSRRRHTRFDCDWSSDVCSSDLVPAKENRVVINKDVKKRATATKRAPQKLNPASNSVEINEPTVPPAGMAPRTAGEGKSGSSDGRENSSKKKPPKIGRGAGRGRGWISVGARSL